MSDKLVTKSSFKELNTEISEKLQGEGRKVKMLKRIKSFIPLSPNVNDTNYSTENKENDPFNMNSYSMINNTSVLEKNTSPFKEEPQVVPGFERYTWPLPEEIPKTSKLPDKQIPRGQTENSSPVSKISRHSYAEVLKSNISPNSKPGYNFEFNHHLHSDQEENCKSDEEINYPIHDYKNPFGVIGRNMVDKEESKKLSECQRRYSCNLNEENTFLNDEFSDISFKIDIPAVEEESICFDEETKGLISENCFRNELSNENILQQEYSDITDLQDAVEFGVITKATDTELLDHIPELLVGNETYSNQCVTTNALPDTLDIIYPLNINWNGDSNCAETLRKDISSSIKHRTDLSPSHDSSFTSQVEVIPIEHVWGSSNSSVFLSNTLRVCGKNFKSKRPVLFIPLQSLKQDVEAQDLNVSPTHIAIESELSKLWKEKSQKSFDKNSTNVSYPDGQEPDYENKQNVQSNDSEFSKEVQRFLNSSEESFDKNSKNAESQEPGYENKQNVQPRMEDSEFSKEVQRCLNGSADEKASSMSDSATVFTSCSSSILMTAKGINYNNVTDHPSELIIDAGAQIINDTLSLATNYLKSILNETSNILRDYDSSLDVYKSVRDEVLQDIKEMNQRICRL